MRHIGLVSKLDHEAAAIARPGPGYTDLHGHLEALEAANLLLRIDEPVNKDTELHPLFLEHLRNHLGIKGVVRVSMHEPLTALRRVIVVQDARGVPERFR